MMPSLRRLKFRSWADRALLWKPVVTMRRDVVRRSTSKLISASSIAAGMSWRSLQYHSIAVDGELLSPADLWCWYTADRKSENPRYPSFWQKRVIAGWEMPKSSAREVAEARRTASTLLMNASYTC